MEADPSAFTLSHTVRVPAHAVPIVGGRGHDGCHCGEKEAFSILVVARWQTNKL